MTTSPASQSNASVGDHPVRAEVATHTEPSTRTTDQRRTRRITLTGRNGAQVAASLRDSGTGREVVFLHGLVGLNEHWEDVVDRINDRWRCRLLELPLLDLAPADCSIEAVTELTASFLKVEVRRPVTLVGNSFGGHVALRIALDHPELCDALVLAGASGLMERTLVRGAPVRPSRDWRSEKIGELFFNKDKMRDEDLERAFAALRARGGARAMVRLSKTARRDNLQRRLAEVAAPTLLIWGREDIVTPPAAAELFLENLPDARIAWIDRCGHAPMIESPEAFADAMLRFVDELDERDVRRAQRAGAEQP